MASFLTPECPQKQPPAPLERKRGHPRLTLKAVGIEEVLALLVAFHSTLTASHSLPGNAPEQPFALIAIGGGCGCPHFKVVWSGQGHGVDECLQSLFENVQFLWEEHNHQGMRERKDVSPSL